MYRSFGEYKVDLYYKGELIDSVVYISGHGCGAEMLPLLKKHFPNEYNPIEATDLLGRSVSVDDINNVRKVLDSTGKLIYDFFKYPSQEKIEFPDGYLTTTKIKTPPNLSL